MQSIPGKVRPDASLCLLADQGYYRLFDVFFRKNMQLHLAALAGFENFVRVRVDSGIGIAGFDFIVILQVGAEFGFVLVV